MNEHIETNGERATRLGKMPAGKCGNCGLPVPVFGTHICGGPITDAMGQLITSWDQVDDRADLAPDDEMPA